MVMAGGISENMTEVGKNMRVLGVSPNHWDTEDAGHREEQLSYDIRLSLATAATKGETSKGRPWQHTSSASLPSLSSSSASSSSSNADNRLDSSLCKLDLLRARTKMLRRSSVEILTASKRSLQERLEHSSSSVLDIGELSSDEATVGSMSSRTGSDAVPAKDELPASQEDQDTKIPDHVVLRHHQPRALSWTLPACSTSSSLEEEELQQQQQHRPKEDLKDHLDDLSFVTITIQLETELVALRQQFRAMRHRQKWNLILLLSLILGAVLAAAGYSSMSGGNPMWQVQYKSQQLQTHLPNILFAPTSSATVRKPRSNLLDLFRNEAHRKGTKSESTTMKVPPPSRSRWFKNKIEWNTNHDSLGVWLR